MIVTVALAGVAASFGGQLRIHPELLAVVGLLFMVFALLVLGQDQQITMTARYLLNEDVFGDHARAQAGWEHHKVETMRGGGWIRQPATVAETLARYGAPVVSGLVSIGAAIALAPTNYWTWVLFTGFAALFILFFIAGVKTMQEYVDLGNAEQPE